MRERPRAAPELVVAAFVLMMSSAFGQTYFIALFAPWLKSELQLTDGGFGSLYTLGTLISAGVLVGAGRFADRMRIRVIAPYVLLLLAASCALMAFAASPISLLLALSGLRLFGQSFMGQLAMTGVGRWYILRRGRMMAVAVLGLSVSEAIMPIVAVTLIGVAGWRNTWLIAAGAICAISLPLVRYFLRREPPHDQTLDASDTDASRRQWSQADVLRTSEFVALLPGLLAPPFIMTGIFFHQAHLVEIKGWSLSWFVAWFPLYAGTGLVAALVTGWLIDRFNARRLLPIFLLPMAVAVLALSLSNRQGIAPLFMALAAITSGSASTLLGALWPELFGTRHLGAIRASAFSAQVFATALAPGLMGLLLDLGIPLSSQCMGLAAYTLFAALVLTLLQPRLDRLVIS